MGGIISDIGKSAFNLHDLKDSEKHSGAVGKWLSNGIQKELYGTDQQMDAVGRAKSLQAQIEKHNETTKMLTDQNSGFNSGLSKSISLTDANARYGTQSGIGGTVKPSQLMEIRDPQVKLQKSSARGGHLRQYQISANLDDSSNANMISGAKSGGMSQNINSAGGNGPQNSVDTQNGMNQRLGQSVQVAA